MCKNLYAQITDLQKNQNAPKCKTCGTLVADMGASFDGTEHGNAYDCPRCGAVVLTDTDGNVLNEEY